MNKALLGIFLTVCILGMALIMLNERLHGEYATASVPSPRVQAATSGAPNSQLALGTFPSQQSSLGLRLSAPEPTATTREVRGEASMTRRFDGEQKKREEPARLVRKDEERQNVDVRPIARAELDSRKTEKERERVKPERKELLAEQVRPARKAEPNREKVEAKDAKDAKDDKDANDVKKSLRNFVVFVREKGATVRMDGNTLLQYRTSQMHKPERVLIELDGEWDVPIPKIPRNDMVAQVRVSRQNKKTRVVLDLKTTPRSCRFIQKNKQNLDVRVDS